MGNGTYLRHGWQPWAEGVIDWLQSFLLQVDISEIVVHEADVPNSLVGFLDSEPLAGHHGRLQFQVPRADSSLLPVRGGY